MLLRLSPSIKKEGMFGDLILNLQNSKYSVISPGEKGVGDLGDLVSGQGDVTLQVLLGRQESICARANKELLYKAQRSN
jgi:hypothetical protein